MEDLVLVIEKSFFVTKKKKCDMFLLKTRLVLHLCPNWQEKNSQYSGAKNDYRNKTFLMFYL